MIKRLGNIQGRVLGKAALQALLLAVCMAVPAYAASTSSVTAKFTILQDIVSTVVSSIGTIIVLWGLFEFGNSMQTQEGGAQSQAMKRIGGGLVMVIAPQLLALFK